MIKTGALLLLLVIFAGGCATQMYSWERYEDTIYTSYNAPGEMPAERQIEILEADYQKARSKNKPVPPGWHAHLGFLYYQTGKLDQALQEFQTEKKTFPESTVLWTEY